MTEAKSETPRKRGKPKKTESKAVVPAESLQTEVIDGEVVSSKVVSIQPQVDRKMAKEEQLDEEKRQRMIIKARRAAMGIDLVVGTALQLAKRLNSAREAITEPQVPTEWPNKGDEQQEEIADEALSRAKTVGLSILETLHEKLSEDIW